MGPASQRQLDQREPWWRTEISGSAPDDAEFVDIDGVRCLIAGELATEGIRLENVPGSTHKKEAN
jgi:hypothetical protein